MPAGGTGALPCREDRADYGFARIGLASAGDAGLDSDLTRHVKTVRDQGGSSTCGGQAFAGAIDVVTSQSVHRKRYAEPASALFIYNLAIRQALPPGEMLLDGGIDARSCARVLQKQGTCDERLWPFAANKVLTAPGWDAVFTGAARAGCKYAFIRSQGEQRIGELALVQSAGIPVVVGLDLIRPFAFYDGGTIEQPDGVIWARHFVLLVGRDAAGKRFRFLNSWDDDWGEDGFGWLSDEYVGGRWCWDACAVYGFDAARER